MKVEELIKIAVNNNAEGQMDYEQYECLVALISDGYINSVEQLAEYMDIAECRIEENWS